MRTRYLNLKMDYRHQADGDPVDVWEQAVSQMPIFGYDVTFKIDIDKVAASFKAPAPKSTKSPGKSYTAENFVKLAETARDMAVNNAFGTEESYREELGEKGFEDYVDEVVQPARIYMLWAKKDNSLSLLHAGTVDSDSMFDWADSWASKLFAKLIEKGDSDTEYRWGYIRVPRGMLI